MTSRTLYSLEAERALLGCIILREGVILDDLGPLLTEESFYRPDHGRLYLLLRNMHATGVPIDRVSVGERILSHRDGDDAFGGYGYVLSLPEAAPSSVNWKHYAGTVASLGRLRQARRAIASVLEDVDTGRVDDPKALTAALEVVSAEVASTGGESSWVTWKEAHEAAVAEIESVQRGETSQRTIRFPWRALSDIVPGLRVGQMGIVAARPAMGKSSLAMQVVEVACGDPKVAVGVFSLELPATELAYRSLAGSTGSTVRDLQAGRMDQAAWDAVEDASAGWDVGLYLCKRGGVTVEDIVAETLALKRSCARREQELRGIVVDHVGLVTASKHTSRMNEAGQLGHITGTLKQLAIGASIGVLVVSQLNRKLEDRADKRPQVADLRGSGTLEQDADWIVMLYREWVYNREADARRADALVVKHRGGDLGECALGFDGPRMRFYDREADFQLADV